MIGTEEEEEEEEEKQNSLFDLINLIWVAVRFVFLCSFTKYLVELNIAVTGNPNDALNLLLRIESWPHK